MLRHLANAPPQSSLPRNKTNAEKGAAMDGKARIRGLGAPTPEIYERLEQVQQVQSATTFKNSVEKEPTKLTRFFDRISEADVLDLISPTSKTFKPPRPSFIQ